MLERIRNWFKRVIKEFAPTPSELERKRDCLADTLSTIAFRERQRYLEELSDADPELYASWLLHPHQK